MPVCLTNDREKKKHMKNLRIQITYNKFSTKIKLSFHLNIQNDWYSWQCRLYMRDAQRGRLNQKKRERKMNSYWTMKKWKEKSQFLFSPIASELLLQKCMLIPHLIRAHTYSNLYHIPTFWFWYSKHDFVQIMRNG